MIDVNKTNKDFWHPRYMSCSIYCYDLQNKCIKFGDYKRGHTIHSLALEEKKLSNFFGRLEKE